MNNNTTQEFQNFIKASAVNKNATNTLTQKQISDADFYRKKYLKVIEKYNEESDQKNEQDWEEKLRRENAEAQSDNLKDIIKTRKYLKIILLCILILWLFFVGIIVLLQGFNVNIHIKGCHIYFKLANSVMNMLLGTTTASVFGLYKAVTDYFFKNDNKN
nr:MAG TPA: hypothetical protein [Caudoviricetes sp.]